MYVFVFFLFVLFFIFFGGRVGVCVWGVCVCVWKGGGLKKY